MKYIKKFESIDSKEIVKLCQHIRDFFYRINGNNSIEIEYDFEAYNNRYNFFNMLIHHKGKYLFSFSLIDYYSGDVDRFFEFTRANNRFLNDDENELVEFIDITLNRYNKNQDMISFSDIPNIINDINKENFNIFVGSKKYNL